MINHARTLLLNKPGSYYQLGVLGEEYIPADFASLYMPSYIKTPYQIIFGVNPDKVFVNYRLRELMALIHQTELAEFVYALDPRVTYWPQNDNNFLAGTLHGSVSKVAGFDAARLRVLGDLRADNIRGRAFHEYFIRIVTVDGYERAFITAAGEADSDDKVIDWVAGYNNGGASKLIRLPGSNLFVQFFSVVESSNYSLALEATSDYLLLQNGDRLELTLEDLPVLPFTYQPELASGAEVVTQWNLQVYAQPESAISAVLPKLDLLGEPLFLELFGLGTEEPFNTFKNIWADHEMPVYRLAAFVLAMIYRMHGFWINT